MADYVYDDGDLPFPKSDLIPLPGTEDPTKWVVALDWNTVCQAVEDARGGIINGQWWGLRMPVVEPTTPPVDSVRLFLRKSPGDSTLLQLCVKFSTGEVVTIVETTQP